MRKKIYTPRQRVQRFWLWLALGAELFLILAGIGLLGFWEVLEAYEASNPQHAIDAYMRTATPQYLSARDPELVAGLDGKLQSPEAARQVIADSLKGPISYAKNTKKTTADRRVYMLLCGGRTLGEVVMTVERTDRFGFEYWAVTEESYDFSYLLGQPQSITVPEDFPVYAGGALLGEDYRTETDIPYPEVAEYYAQYDLPALCTYTVPPVLGQLPLLVTDPQGSPVEITAETDLSRYLQNCSREELDRVSVFAGDFAGRYTDFTSVTGGQGSMRKNLSHLTQLMVPGGKLASRMEEAIPGLTWVTDRRAEVKTVTVNRCLRLEEGRYLCDMTYVVKTRDFNGAVEATSNLKLILVTGDEGLLAESMVSYE